MTEAGPVTVIEVLTGDVDATRALAAAIAALCRSGDVLLLAGDLGAGKTAFAQGFGWALGVAEPITSPTFTLVRQYPVGDGPASTAAAGGAGRCGAVRMLFHADVYRLDDLAEVVDLGLGELVEDGGVALVEWGDVAAPVLGAGSLTVRLAAVEAVGGDPGPPRPDGSAPAETRRRVTVSADGSRWVDRWEALEAALHPWRVP